MKKFQMMIFHCFNVVLKKTALLLLLSFFTHSLFGQTQRTLTYYKDKSMSLEMDVFIPKNEANVKMPVFIYVHGGGFSSGSRNDGHAICKHLANSGYITASISYTLYMKDKSFSCDGVTGEKVKAIQFAVNDLWLATAFLTEIHDLNIDPSKIFIGGCSAGAEVVLHAQHWNYEKMNIYEKQLPAGFKYAGIIAGAGAIMDINMITRENMVPTMMFHGNCDLLVPYGTAAHHYCDPNSPGWLMFFGSYSIFQHLEELGCCSKLYTYCGGGHEFANTLFEKDLQNVQSFLADVISDRKYTEHVIISTDNSCELSKKYIFCK